MRLLQSKSLQEGEEYNVCTVFVHDIRYEMEIVHSLGQDRKSAAVPLFLVDAHCSSYENRIALITEEGNVVGHLSDQRALKVRQNAGVQS